jgi:hypothetical protein
MYRRALLDHLVGAEQDRGRDRQADRLCSFWVDHHFELGRSLNRRLGRLRAAQDPVNVSRAAAELIDDVNTIEDKTARDHGDLDFTELTIASLLGYPARGVTQGYVHLDAALVCCRGSGRRRNRAVVGRRNGGGCKHDER